MSCVDIILEILNISPMTKRIYGYCRCSRLDQSTDGLSIDTQIDQISAYAKLYDLEVVAFFIDEGLTGKNLNRPELTKALELLASGEAEGLLVSKLDRLSRSVKDLAYLMDEVFNTAELHSVAERLDTSSPHGRLAINIISSVSQWEVETISVRTKDALATLKKQGKYYGGRAPKYGYRADADNNLVRDNCEMKVIRKAKKLRASGLSFQKVASELAKVSMFSRTGAAFDPTQIRRMVSI